MTLSEPGQPAIATDKYLAWAGLMAALLLGAWFRLHHLGEQSLWYDEWNSIVYPADADFGQHMLRIRYLNPDHVPLYYMMDFVWAKLTLASAGSQRVLGVLLDLCSIALLFRIGCHLHRHAGALAALFFALSPYHIYTAQSIRPYPLLIFLALASTLVAIALFRRRDAVLLQLLLLLLHSAMIWTHLSGVLFIAAQLSVLMLARWRAFGTPYLVILHVAALAPICWLALAFLQSVEAIQEQSFSEPGLAHMYDLFFRFEVPFANVELLPDAFALPGALERFSAVLPATGWALSVLFLAAVLWQGMLLIRAALGRKQTAQNMPVQWLVFACALGPALGVTAVTFLVTPLFMPRMAIAGTAFLYLLLALLISRLPRRMAAAAGGMVVLGYLAQAIAFHGAATRTQWKQLAERVQGDWKAGDLAAARDSPGRILVTSPALLQTYLPNGEVVRAASFLQGIQFALSFFDDPSHAGNKVWLALSHYYAIPDLTVFESIIKDTGLSFERTDFLAMEKLSLYALRPGQEKNSLDLKQAVANRVEQADFAEILERLQLAPESTAYRDAMVALAIGFDMAPPPVPLTANDIADMARRIAMVDMPLAVQLLQDAPKEPDAILPPFFLGELLMVQENMGAADAAFTECLPLVAQLPRLSIGSGIMLDLMEAFAAKDCDAITRQLETMRHFGIAEGPRMGWSEPAALETAAQKICAAPD